MNCFFADDHYGVNPGRHIFELLPEDFRRETVFTENDWSLLESGEWEKDCELLALHMIAGTCGQPMPGPGAEKAVRAYCEHGGDLLLLCEPLFAVFALPAVGQTGFGTSGRRAFN